MNILTVTSIQEGSIEPGMTISISIPRPPWYRLLRLWRWWRGERYRHAVIIERTSNTTFTLSECR